MPTFFVKFKAGQWSGTVDVKSTAPLSINDLDSIRKLVYEKCLQEKQVRLPRPITIEGVHEIKEEEKKDV